MSHKIIFEFVRDVVLKAIKAARFLLNLDRRSLLTTLKANFAFDLFAFVLWCFLCLAALRGVCSTSFSCSVLSTRVGLLIFYLEGGVFALIVSASAEFRNHILEMLLLVSCVRRE